MIMWILYENGAIEGGCNNNFACTYASLRGKKWAIVNCKGHTRQSTGKVWRYASGPRILIRPQYGTPTYIFLSIKRAIVRARLGASLVDLVCGGLAV